ncbi:hypothetical protein N7456_008439 [Penicillium angulare]|uniref:Uncharacterized protein n=1 Tax=Penicillium angulare TaxID=116970 RepID=A0A9W9FCK7_9EURO|nr:hypothetical protein N7456_008439 [Penicillium angulare]
MSYFHTEYRKFLANPRSSKVADNISLLYVASTTKFEGSDSVITHLSRQSGIVKKKSENVINAIEASDSLVLDIETTLEFLEGGGAYLPSLDDNFLADRVVTIPTLHIVHWNAEHEISQIRIYWDQGSLLKEVEIIGARSRSWPIRAGAEQTRLLKAAAAAKSAPPPAPSQNGSKEAPARPGSPGKRHIKDPYAADSLFDLLSPSKADAARDADDVPRPSSPGKKHRKDPYAADSLTDLLSPSKQNDAPIRPYAASSVKPPTRDLSDLFIDEEAPGTPSKPEKVVAPKGGAGRAYENRIFGSEDTLDPNRAAYKSNPTRFNHFELGGGEEEKKDTLDPTRAAYKSNPTRFNHFEIGGDKEQDTLDPTRAAYKSNPTRFNHFEIGNDEFSTPQKPTRAPLSEQAQNFGYSETAEEPTPPPRQHVVKPRRDADVHFEMADKADGDDGRIISSYQNRGKGLYENRLFGDEGEAMPSERETKNSRPLSVAHNANRQKDFDSHWDVTEDSPAPPKTETENTKPLISHRQKAINGLQSSWDNYPDSPAVQRTVTSLHNPSRHNQPSWSYGNDE